MYCKFKHIMFTYIAVYIYTYIHKYVPYIGRPTRRNSCVPVITGSVSLEMRVMERAARKSSNCRPASGRITRVRTSTMASVRLTPLNVWLQWCLLTLTVHLAFVSLIFCFFVSDKNFQWQLENIFSKLSQPLVRGWPSSKAPLGKYPQPLRS